MGQKSRADIRQGVHSRIRKKVKGSAERPRLAVFRSLNHIYAQVIDDKSGTTLATASTTEKALGVKAGGNIAAAKTIGKAVADVVDEEHSERPLEIYSANKGVAEKYYRIYHRVHDLKTVVLRFANLYGPYGKGFPEFGFINYFISLAQAGEEIRIFGDGAEVRPFREVVGHQGLHGVPSPASVRTRRARCASSWA